MKIKFESDNPADLHEFHLFLYKKDPDLLIEEENMIKPGSNNEPLVIAIIVAVGASGLLPFLKDCYKEFISLKKAKVEAKTEILKVSIQKGRSWEYKDDDEFLKIDMK